MKQWMIIIKGRVKLLLFCLAVCSTAPILSLASRSVLIISVSRALTLSWKRRSKTFECFGTRWVNWRTWIALAGRDFPASRCQGTDQDANNTYERTHKSDMWAEVHRIKQRKIVWIYGLDYSFVIVLVNAIIAPFLWAHFRHNIFSSVKTLMLLCYLFISL